MDAVHKSELSSVYHVEEPDMNPSGAALVARLCGGDPPRLFALVREDFDENDAAVREIVGYGIALPNGSAATIPTTGQGYARWISPESASRRLCSDLIWLAR